MYILLFCSMKEILVPTSVSEDCQQSKYILIHELKMGWDLLISWAPNSTKTVTAVNSVTSFIPG